MKVSWQWLSQLLDLSYTNPVSMAQALTIAGFEVENIKEIDASNIKDTILEIVAIPNRHDLGSITGIAREVAALLQQNLDFNFYNLSFLYYRNNLCQINLNRDLNGTYCIIILMNNIKVQQSAQCILHYLKLANVQPINNVIDIKNYIKLKWGQDIQIFNISELDAAHQRSNLTIESCMKLNVDLTKMFYKQKTMNSFSKDLIKVSNLSRFDMLVPVHTMLIKVSIPINLNRQNCYNTSHNKRRKEGQNVDKNILYHAVQESIFLYKKFCNALIQDYQVLVVHESLQNHIKVMKRNLIRILGPTTNNGEMLLISEPRVTKILSLLNLNPMLYSSFWLVTIPRYRYHDLKREIDIIEEIARMYGLNYFNDTVPPALIKNRLSQRQLLQRQVRSFLRSVGLHELVHSSLQKTQNVDILNPLSNEYNGLRCNLTARLIQSCYYNVCQKNSELEGFEIGKVFYINPVNNVIHERLHLGVIWTCKNYLRSKWSHQPISINWLQAKGILSNLCQVIGIDLSWKKANSNFYLNQILCSQRTANLYSSKKPVGFFGEVNPELSYDLGIKTRFYAFELDLDTILYQINSNPALNYQLKPYSKYPYVMRDISMIVPKSMSISSVICIISSINNPFIQSIEVFDEYSGDQVSLNSRSVSLRLKYQSSDKTLTNTQIAQLDNSVKHIIKNKLNIEIRL